MDDEILGANIGGERDSVAGAEFSAGGEGGVEQGEGVGIYFVSGDVEGERARVLGDDAANQSESERAAAGPGIDHAPVVERAVEKGGDKFGQRRRGEELPELAFLRLGFGRSERRQGLGEGGRDHIPRFFGKANNGKDGRGRDEGALPVTHAVSRFAIVRAESGEFAEPYIEWRW